MGLAIIVPSISFEDANLGKVTLSGNVPIRSLSIDLENSYIGTTLDLKCSYLPANTTQRNVIWSIEEGSEYASISGSNLNILSSANNSLVTIKCTSVENPNISVTKNLNLTYSGGPAIYDWLKTDASSSSYVNIGKLGRNDKLTIIGKLLSFQNTDDSSTSSIFGVAKTQNTDWIYSLYRFDRNSKVNIRLGSTTYEKEISPNTPEFSIIIDINTGNTQYGYDTFYITVNEDAFVNGETNNDCFVFAANNAGTPASIMHNNVYALKEFKIERNSQVIHDFKPALLRNEKGLYDTVTNQFKPNLGTGDFILEND